MKPYIQPDICVQAIEASTIICVSVTNVKSNIDVNIGGEHLGTQYAI